MASAPNDSSTSGYATEKIWPPVSRSYKPMPPGNDRLLPYLGMRGVPLAGEALGFGKVFRSQLIRSAVAKSLPEAERHAGTDGV